MHSTSRASSASKVYVSTGGFRDRCAVETAIELSGVSDWGVELSGGKPCSNADSELLDLGLLAKVSVHNYWPPSQESFTLDIAAKSREERHRSVAFARMAIVRAASLGAKRYSIHAGFVSRVPPESLGKRIRVENAASRVDALDRMIESLGDLATFAEGHGVRLLVENHALSQENLGQGEHNMLLVDPEEILGVLDALSGRVGLLLDVGHLKTSAQQLNFDAAHAVVTLQPVTEGYHLHENNGLRDEHLPFSHDAWFLPVMRRDLEYYVLEFHSGDQSDWLSSFATLRDHLS